MQRFVLIGGGIAAHRAALELGSRMPGAVISLLSEEAGLPYDRPPLSKEILLGRKDAPDVLLKGAAGYADSGIRHLPGGRVSAIDRRRRRVRAADGRSFSYDALLIATGSRPRRLPEAVCGDAEILYLRTLRDALRLREGLQEGRHVAIIGGGFIGLEVAAAAIGRGCRVTVLEAGERILARGMPVPVSEWIHRLHRNRGVEIRLSAKLARVRQEREGFRLSGPGWEVPADLVVAGIGVEPNVELAMAAGLAVDDGLVVDAQCRTSDPHIFGAGEVTSRPVRIGGRRRIESWKASAEQGAAAAAVMTGAEAVCDDVPWLWSDQFDCNIQLVGFPDLASRYEVLGRPEQAAWTLVGLDEGATVVGGIAINRGRDASLLKRAVRDGVELSAMASRIPA